MPRAATLDRPRAAAPKRRDAKASEPNAEEKAICAAATLFVDAGERKRVAEREYERSREALKKWMGDEKVRFLPDGRVVNKEIVPRAAELTPRAAGFSTFISVLPAPIPS
jgi:hypothetical protein